MHIAERFETLLGAYPHPDGRAWTGQEIDDATGGVVTRSYITNLRKYRIENPGYEKLRAIAKAVGFPPELWFEEDLPTGSGARIGFDQGHVGIAKKIAHLMEMPSQEASSKSYTDADVARLSFGSLSEEDVEAMRTGRLTDPSVEQVMALADVFGVDPSYFLSRAKSPPLLDREAMDIFRDETVSAIAHKSLHLPGREKEMILSIIRQFEDSRRGADEH
jgi:transcriptional regulator with XRE-family HTH domain